MAKYLIHGSYTLEGIKGVVREGGVSRREVVQKSIAGLGGKMEAFYFAFGGDDVFVIAELPDNLSAVAMVMATAVGGGFRPTTTVLLTPEEVDQAKQKIGSIGYRAPGQ